MNIWLISKYAGLPRYGFGARLFYLAREFARNGHKTLLLTSDANHLAKYPETNIRYNHEDADGINVCWIKTRKYLKTASLGRVLSWIDFERKLFFMPREHLPRPDVVIISSLSLLSVVYGYHLKKVYGAFLVFEVRDIWPLTMVAEGGFHRWHPLVILLGMIERFGYRKADLVVGTMPRLDIHVRETIGYDRPFHCSPLGYASEWTAEETPLPEEFFQRYFPVGKVILGYAGSMGITNALDPLMHCIERLSGRTDIHFVLVGSGDLKAGYMTRLSERANVTFAPRIERSQVPSFLRRCDVLYLAAHDSPVWRFGQSLNKMIDYMMAGKPVIASFSGSPSMLNEADAGIFVQAGDASALEEQIIRFAEMPIADREKMGQRGKDWILANRSYERLAKAYLSAINARINAHAGRSQSRTTGKRAFDIVAVLMSSPAWLPLVLLLAIAVRLTNGRPLLFRQPRPGLHGKPFMLFKFRTMTLPLEAEGRMLPDSARITALGRCLRSSSLDELPELLNVLRGEMSLVGPRPLLMEYLPLYTPEQARRHDVKPGITGWAQVNGRNAISWQDKFKLDVWYVDHQSLSLDLKILLMTVWKIFRGDGISHSGHATMPKFTGKE